jgi:hypothetical protein
LDGVSREQRRGFTEAADRGGDRFQMSGDKIKVFFHGRLSFRRLVLSEVQTSPYVARASAQSRFRSAGVGGTFGPRVLGARETRSPRAAD